VTALSTDLAGAAHKRWALLAFGVLLTGLCADLVVRRVLGSWSGLVHQARLSYLERVPPMFWPRADFTPEAWTASPPGERYRFAKSIIATNRLLGLTSSQVASLLGGLPPVDQGVYPLRSVGFQNLWWVLIIDVQDGQVARVRRGMAFLDH
jgi:hypothetical protein